MVEILEPIELIDRNHPHNLRKTFSEGIHTFTIFQPPRTKHAEKNPPLWIAIISDDGSVYGDRADVWRSHYDDMKVEVYDLDQKEIDLHDVLDGIMKTLEES